MRFQDFTKYLKTLEHTSGRIEMDGLPGKLFQGADVWVGPKIVVTVPAGAFTRSPVQAAWRDADGRGLALRFPRVIGFVRAGKSPEDANTALEIEELFTQQRVAKQSTVK